MILLTDGVGTWNPSLIGVAVAERITIYTIGLGSSINEAQLQSIATGTGGQYFHVANAADLPDVFREIDDEIDEGKDTDEDGLTDWRRRRASTTARPSTSSSRPTRASRTPTATGSTTATRSTSTTASSRATSSCTRSSLTRAAWIPKATASTTPPRRMRARGPARTRPTATGSATSTSSSSAPTRRRSTPTATVTSTGRRTSTRDGGFDPLVPTEVLSDWDYAGHFVLGATCGELFGFCNRDTVAWLAGNISGGLFVVTDIRDAIGQLFQGELVGAGLSILSVVPVAGDALSVVAKTVKFITRAASKAGDALRMVFRSDLPQWAKIRIIDDVAGGVVTRARDLGVTDDALERLGKAGVDFKLLDEAMAGASAVVRTGFVDWRGAEAILRSNFGGAAKGFKTIDGLKGTKGYRFVDAFDETLAVAREAKTGIARLTPFVQEQIRKDVLLRGKLNWSKVEWHFFASSRSDSLGPTKELMDELAANGIGWVIHLP